MTDEIIDVRPTQALARQDRSAVLLMPVMDVPTALARLAEFQSFCAQYLTESLDGGTDGGDYGIIPGTKKKTLLKSGAEKLCEIYGLADDYAVISHVENWDSGLFDYTLRCTLKSRRDDSVVGTGVGSCSSYEAKYRWREQQKSCPACGIASIIKGRDFTNSGKPAGWLCWKKKGGCGATFRDGDPAIEAQPVGRIENPDIFDTKNTVLKMAKKRAKIDAVIGVTRSSGIFTQDMEDAAQAAPPVRQDAPGPMIVEAQPNPAPAVREGPRVANASTTRQPAVIDRDSDVRSIPPAVTDTELPPPARISEAQRKRFFAIGKSNGWTNDGLRDMLLREGYSSSTEITKARYEAICNVLERGPETSATEEIFS
jgi:hypothetical protein